MGGEDVGEIVGGQNMIKIYRMKKIQLKEELSLEVARIIPAHILLKGRQGIMTAWQMARFYPLLLWGCGWLRGQSLKHVTHISSYVP